MRKKIIEAWTIFAVALAFTVATLLWLVVALVLSPITVMRALLRRIARA